MIVLVGKSASGKTSIMKELLQKYPDLTHATTYTTRPPREGEVNGVDYYFISTEEFLKKKNEGFFLETTKYKVASGDIWYYGSSAINYDTDSVIIANPEGCVKIKNSLANKYPVIFYIYANEDIIRDRLKKRGDNIEESQRRIEADNKDFENILNVCDFSLKNEEEGFSDVVDLINCIYIMEKTNRKKRKNYETKS